MQTLIDFLRGHQIGLVTLAIALPFGLALTYCLKKEKTEAAEDQLPLVPEGTFVLRATRSKHFLYFICEFVPAAILLYVAIAGFQFTCADLTDGIVDTENIIIDAILSIAAGSVSAYLFYRIFARYKRLSDQIIVSAEGIVATRWRPFSHVTTSYAWTDIKSVQIYGKFKHFLALTYQVPTLHIVTSQQEETIALLCFLLDRNFRDALDYYRGVSSTAPDAEGRLPADS